MVDEEINIDQCTQSNTYVCTFRRGLMFASTYVFVAVSVKYMYTYQRIVVKVLIDEMRHTHRLST